MWSLSVEIVHFDAWGPVAGGLCHQVRRDEGPLFVSQGAARHLAVEVGDLHPDLPTRTETDDVAGDGRGVVPGHCRLGHDGDGIKLRPGGAVSLKLEQVVHGAMILLQHALCVDLVVDLREDMVVAAGGDSECLVRLVEDHPSVHKGVGIVGRSGGIFTTLPSLLVAMHILG